MTLKEAFFKDLAHHLVMWRDDLVAAIKDPSTATWADSQSVLERLNLQCGGIDAEDLRAVLNECFRGILHSTLVTLDGGSDVSETGTLQLIDADTQQPLTAGALHEEFFQYLAEHDML
jgi:hypothetical protein